MCRICRLRSSKQLKLHVSSFPINFVLNENFVSHLLLLVVLYLISLITSSLTLWYFSGLLLLLLGLILLNVGGDIFIGFLWIIDFGVGLLFLLFLTSFTSFLQTQTRLNLFIAPNYVSSKIIISLLMTVLVWYAIEVGRVLCPFNYTSFFLICWYNFYNVENVFLITNLTLLKTIYFYQNSFIFIIINFLIFFGLMAIIFLFYLRTSKISLLRTRLISKMRVKQKIESHFIRNQSAAIQQITKITLRNWTKSKHLN